MVLGELPVFLDAVRQIRRDPRTRGVRIIIDFGPAHQSGAHTSGWRNSHALAAASAYLRRALSPKSQDKNDNIGAGFLEISTAAAAARTALDAHALPSTHWKNKWTYDLPDDAGELGIEMLATPVLAVTLPRLLDTADGLHYMKLVS
jgi:hypothetical protein